MGLAVVRSRPTNAASNPVARRETAESGQRVPAPFGRLNGRAHEGSQRCGAQYAAGHVEAWRSEIPALWHERQNKHDGHSRFRKLDQEGAAPPELLQKRAASDRAEGHRQWG